MMPSGLHKFAFPLGLLGTLTAGHPCAIAKEAHVPGKVVSAEPQTEEGLKEYLKPIPAKSPDEALKSFETVGGFRMELVAHEPLVASPIAAEFDENGQLYVCEMR